MLLLLGKVQWGHALVIPGFKVHRVGVEGVQALELVLIRCIVYGRGTKVVPLLTSGQAVVQHPLQDAHLT